MLEADGEEIKARLLALLPRWYEGVFLPYEPEWREAAERDAGVKRELARSNSPTQLTELATRGYQYAPVPGIRTLAFFPSWWMRPWVVLWEHRGTKIFCYPIGTPAEEGASPAEVARVYKALGDEGRLKLLRRLSDGSLTLAEAAEELGVAKSTAHHHLAILRQAGFVTVRDGRRQGLQPPRRPAGDRRSARRLSRRVEVLLDDRVEHPVDPAVPLTVRLSLDALANVARSLCVALGALVEAVDLELEPVEAALADQVVLQEPRASSASRRPRKSGWIAMPLRCAMRLRAFVRSQSIAPARSPSSSITSTPPSSGSRSSCSAIPSRS
jgi:DNA-binding transcriptional ArsR family regulator